jgi:hypothetical protein
METYQILRQLDHLKTAINNLTRELFFMFPNTTNGSGGFSRREEGLKQLFQENIDRIDGIAEMAKKYREANKLG